jgi:hypothetical protein
MQPMEIDNDFMDAFDRVMRSYVTAMLLEDDEDMVRIVKAVNEYKNHPAFVIMMLASYGAMTAHLMSLFLEEPTNEGVFEIWSEISQSIEMEAILGDEL